MPYKRSQAIEQRLQSVISSIRSEHHSTPTLAKRFRTSQPTISRCLTALRERGYEIRSVRDESGWHYEVVAEPVEKSKG